MRRHSFPTRRSSDLFNNHLASAGNLLYAGPTLSITDSHAHVMSKPRFTQLFSCSDVVNALLAVNSESDSEDKLDPCLLKFAAPIVVYF